MTGVLIFVAGFVVGGAVGYYYDKIAAKVEKLFE